MSTLPESLGDGRYERREPLGSGAFGEVALYFDSELERQVAVKFCRREGEPADLREEARRLAKLDHPNIVRVFDVLALEDGGTAIVIELVRGQLLYDEIGRRRFHAQTRGWIDQIASALAEAHRNGITHSDLHPGNVAIVASSVGGVPVLLDFGLGRRLGEGFTPHPDDVYHAPEVARGVSPASDFWSLGLIAAELASGQTVSSMLKPDLSGTHDPQVVGPRVREVIARLGDSALAGLIDRLLDVDPLRRATREEVTARLGPQQSAVRKQGAGVGLASVAVKDGHSEVWRVTARRRVHHKWHDDAWSDWHDFEFNRPAIDVAAVSGWPGHVEAFVLDSTGRIWHRWWWRDGGWTKSLHDLGQPFGADDVKGISATSARDGHLEVFVEAADGRIANVWYTDDGWNRCNEDWALQDGWWPFSR